LGGGGHSAALLSALRELGGSRSYGLLGVDRDPTAIARARERFRPEIESGVMRLFQGPFSAIAPLLDELPVLGLLADLGFSSDQLEDPGRGLSFQREGPVDMRLDPTRGPSALDFLRSASEREIADTLFTLSEERFSRRIASVLVEARRRGELPETTKALAELVSRAIPAAARHASRNGPRIHPATRTFQALRIRVNGELEELASLLDEGVRRVRPGGRVAIISFHSLEDRSVKRRFRGEPGKPDPDFEPLTKKPIEPDAEEIAANPRARSAKLRIAERRDGSALHEGTGGIK
jgi:16S rRNA (cytosine1402-N4)-methyltransferase